MLDAREEARLQAVLEECWDAGKKWMRENPTSARVNILPDDVADRVYAPVDRLWLELAGEKCDRAEVTNHLLSKIGPPCAQCDKPLRTSKASMCAACGAKVVLKPRGCIGALLALALLPLPW